jgi:putative peptidoglycan lipid II flippase
MTFSNEFLFRFFGLFLNQGAISCLNYALRVMMIVVGIFGLAVAAASYPFLSRLAAESKTREMTELAVRIIRTTSALTMPISVVMAVLAPELLAALFQRGRFTAASTAATAPVLQAYLLGAFAFAGSTIVMRCFYAVQNTLLPTIVSTIAVVCTLPLYWLLGRSMGPPGIGLAASFAALAQFAAMLALWSARLHDGGVILRVAGTLARIFVASTTAGLACYGIRFALRDAAWHPTSPLLVNLAVVAACAIPATLVAFIMLDLLRVQSIRETVRIFLRK